MSLGPLAVRRPSICAAFAPVRYSSPFMGSRHKGKRVRMEAHSSFFVLHCRKKCLDGISYVPAGAGVAALMKSFVLKTGDNKITINHNFENPLFLCIKQVEALI